jgi:tricarballylate dehydrogenase
MVQDTKTYDVVVVGTGISGLSAAAAAHENGASVLIVERAIREERGGNTRWTESLLRMKSETEVSDDFVDFFSNNAGHHIDPSLIEETMRPHDDWSSIVKSHGFADPELIGTFAETAPDTLAWLRKFGIRFDHLPTYFLMATQPRISPVGGGLAMIEALAHWLEERDVPFLYETTAQDLLFDDEGRVAGLKVTTNTGRHNLKARHVILASGGFEGNPEMLARYVGPTSRYIRPVARGGYFNKGEGIRMALDAGAAAAGDFSRFHAEPLDPRSGAPEPIVLVFNYGVLLNQKGERFIDEGSRNPDACYEEVSREIMGQPDGIAYAILDAKIEDVPNWRKTVRTDQPAITADTLEDLAIKLKVEVATMMRTIEAFNAACPASDQFQALTQDGLRTNESLYLPKSNWSRPLTQGPFIAYPMICGNCFTFGGVKVNVNSQVLTSDGREIAGLYAAGEVIGLYWGSYAGGTSVLRGAVFGSIAGRHAALH